MKMTETQKKDIRLMVAMADFMTNCNFAADMSDSIYEFGCFFYEKLSDILKSDKESEKEWD